MPGNSAVKCSRRTWGMAAVYGLVLGSCTDSCVKGSMMVLVGGMPSRMQAAANLSTAKQVLQFTRHTRYWNCCCLLCAEQGGRGGGGLYTTQTHPCCTSSVPVCSARSRTCGFLTTVAQTCLSLCCACAHPTSSQHHVYC